MRWNEMATDWDKQRADTATERAEQLEHEIDRKEAQLEGARALAHQLQAHIGEMNQVKDLHEQQRELELQLQREQDKNRQLSANIRRTSIQITTTKASYDKLKSKHMYVSERERA